MTTIRFTAKYFEARHRTLNAEEEAFCQAWCVTGDALAAYRSIHPKTKPENVRKAASRLEADPAIQDRIGVLMKAKIEAAHPGFCARMLGQT